MNISLRKVDSMVEDAIVAQSKEPILSQSIKEKVVNSTHFVVAGLQVRNSDAEANALEAEKRERQDVIMKYKVQKGMVHRKLERLDVTPLALLPAKAWRAICERNNLYRLHPDKDGKVGINLTRLQERAKEHVGYAMLQLLTVVLAVSVVMAPLYIFPDSGMFDNNVFEGTQGGELVGSLLEIIATLTTMALCTLLLILLYRLIKQILIQNNSAKLTCRPWAEQLKDVMPGMVSSGSKYHVRVTLNLPDAPKEILDTLYKLHELDLRVAAVPEAIDFVNHPYSVIRKQDGELNNDPIIYYEEDEVVAIIAQYGNFAIDKDVVNQVIYSEYLL